MYNVSYHITIGGKSFRSGQSSALLELSTSASFDVPVNGCRLVLHPEADVKARPDDEVTVEIGYDESLSRVFTGRVASFEQGLRQIRVEALGSFTALTTARFNLLYEKQTAGDVVKDVLGKLELKKATVEDGVKFATYVLHDGPTVWDHLRGLARRCGFDFYADAEDQAVFMKYAPKKKHALTYGVEILAYAHESRPPVVEGVEVYGSSPAGQGQGEDASAWFTKKEVKGAAGKTSGAVLRVVDAAARNQNLAGDLAKNIMHGYEAEAQGRLRTLGAPEVRLGDAVKLGKLPVAAHNGEARVTSVRHRLDARHGFITNLLWEKV